MRGLFSKYEYPDATRAIMAKSAAALKRETRTLTTVGRIGPSCVRLLKVSKSEPSCDGLMGFPLAIISLIGPLQYVQSLRIWAGTWNEAKTVEPIPFVSARSRLQECPKVIAIHQGQRKKTLDSPSRRRRPAFVLGPFRRARCPGVCRAA